MSIAKSASAVALLSLLAACGSNNPDDTPQTVSAIVDFDKGIDGWVGGSSDYTVGTEPSGVVFEQRALGAPLTGKGYYITGHNRSDDMFLYVKKQFHGLVKSSSYKVTFTLKFASSVPSGCFGVGGSPGESVYVYAAALDNEPKTTTANNHVTMNFDKGNQGTAGKEAQILGTIGNGLACGTSTPTSKTLKSAAPMTVKTDTNGDLWLLVGIDSGFEASSELTLQTLTVDAEPVIP